MTDLPTTKTTTGSEKTEVGSVFVSNYPAYYFWREDLIPQIDSILNRRLESPAPLGLYVHIPFCRKRCKFCYYKVYTGKNSAEIQAYLDSVIGEYRQQAKKPGLFGRPLRYVYFGGGTPSYLSAKQLQQFFSALKEVLPWDQVEEVTFECEPGTLSEAKVQALRELGVTRLSLGVENFHDKILEENGRAHLSKEIYRVLPWIKAAGFDQLNIDLIAGMVGETWETWKQNVTQALGTEPDSITIYQMELPFNTIYSRRMLEEQSQAPVADWPTKRAWHDYAIEEAATKGYEISSAYTLVRTQSQARFFYRDALWHGADMLGIGVSSFSHVNGVHFQNIPSIDKYRQAFAEGQPTFYRGFKPTEEEAMVRQMILQLKLGRLNGHYFLERFKVDVIAKFAEAWQKLANEGFLSREGQNITLTRAGLLQVDGLLPNFYAEEYQGNRYT